MFPCAFCVYYTTHFLICRLLEHLLSCKMANQVSSANQIHARNLKFTTNDLQLLLNFLTPVAPKCINLGLQLGVAKSRLGIIKKDDNLCEDQLQAIISSRLDQDEPLTLHDLLSALRAPSVGEFGPAREIASNYNIPSVHSLPDTPEFSPSQGIETTHITGSTIPAVDYSSDLGPPMVKRPREQLAPVLNAQPQYLPGQNQSDPVGQFTDFVKTTYRLKQVETNTIAVKWPPTPSKNYINLVCINRHTFNAKSKVYKEITEAMIKDGNVDVIEKKEKVPIKFEDIAEATSAECNDGKLILVEGAPGVGKSTFAWEFCRRWEKGEIAQHYQLVLLLRLRDDSISKAKCLNDLIQHQSDYVRKAVIDDLVSSRGSHALIILEGFDEHPGSVRNECSVFNDLISGQVLPFATILVTSRPWATVNIRMHQEHRIYQHIEVLGFTPNQIQEYLKSTLADKKELKMLQVYLKQHPQLKMGMYIPLNCAIVVTVFQESQITKCPMPTTLNELYFSLARTLLFRYLRSDHTHDSTIKINNFSDLPSEVHSKLRELCKLAHDGIVMNDDVQLIFRDLPSGFDSLGLMDSVTELYSTQGAVSSHNFLHLTFQEFFAAVHISQMSPAEQIEHFQRFKEGRLKVVLKFLAGLNKLDYFTEDSVKDVFQTSVPRECWSSYQISCNTEIDVNLVNWMFETQRDDVILRILGQKTIRFTVERSMLLMDYYSLGYCIAHSQCRWILTVELKCITNDKMKMLAMGAGQKAGGKVVELQATQGGNILPVPVESLNKFGAKCNHVLHLHQLSLQLSATHSSIKLNLSMLKVLKLEMNDKTTNWRLDTLLPQLSLESLTIHSKGNLDCVAIENLIKPMTDLKELCIRLGGELDKDGALAIFEPLENNPLPKLERLEFKCSTHLIVADTLERFITCNATLKSISLEDCTLNAHSLLILAQATLQEKNVRNIKLNGDSGATHWARLLKEFPAVECSSVCSHLYRCIGNGGVRAIAHALCSNTTLKILELSHNSISVQGAMALAEAFTQNSTLKRLELSNNKIRDTGANAFAKTLLHKDSALKELILSSNNITDSGARAIAGALHKNSTLTHLELSFNQISDTGARDLANALQHNSTLQQLHLSHNHNVGRRYVGMARMPASRNTFSKSPNSQTKKL